MKPSKKSNSVGNQKIYDSKYSLSSQGKKLGQGKSTNKTV